MIDLRQGEDDLHGRRGLGLGQGGELSLGHIGPEVLVGPLR